MTVVETVRFKIKPNLEADEFLVQNFYVESEYMALRPGFRGRQTTRDADGEFLIIVQWATPEDAEATMGGFYGAPETQKFLAFVDPASVSSGSYTVIDRS